jgi:GNAT superfamily N-acetyltransferase
MNMPTIRLSRPTDINTVVDLDRKCYPYPADLETWKELLHQSGVSNHAKVIVLEVMRKPYGFAVWNYEENVCHLIKLGVLPAARRQGLGNLLLAKCEGEASWAKKNQIITWVPDLHCKPGDPDDVSTFLHKTGFMATGKTGKMSYRMYGEYRDHYQFYKGIT